MRRLIATIFLCSMAATSAFASGFSIYEASVRANGMLGAFSAYADHVSTIYYNPAGLAKLDGIRFSGGATIIAPRSSFRGPIPYSNQKYEMEEQNFLVPNLYGSYQITEGLTVGIGFYAPFGLGTKWSDDWVGRDLAIETEIQTAFVNPVVAYTLPDFGIGKIHVGAGLRIGVLGEVTLRRAVLNFSPSSEFELVGEMDNTPIGFNAGILYEPMDKVAIGFTYRSEVDIEFAGEADFNELPTFAFPPGTNGGTTLTLPSSWVAALNVKPMEGLIVEADFVYWGWSSYDELVIEFDQIIPAFGDDQLASERGYDDVWQVRLGAEYSVMENLDLRAGIAYDKNPVPDEFIDPTLPDSDRLLFSGGLTYKATDFLDIDLAYIFIRAEERESTSAEHGLDGVYNTYANLPSLGITMKF